MNMLLKSKRKRTEYARLFLYPLQNNFTVIDMCGAFLLFTWKFYSYWIFFFGYVFVFQEDHP